MSVKRLIALAAIVLCVGAGGAAGQQGHVSAVGGASATELSAEERRLVEGSRAAIIAAGLSAEFFDAHFRLAKVFAKPSDRRVVWRFTVGEYETTLNDSIGSYTDEKGARQDAHSIAGRLPAARDIARTIPRQRAARLMKRCIGAYQDEAVVYEASGAPPRAALALLAVSLPGPPKPAKGAPQTKPPAPPEADTIRQGGKKPPPPRIGRIDLETGRCTVGVGQSGSPHPEADKYARPRH